MARRRARDELNWRADMMKKIALPRPGPSEAAQAAPTALEEGNSR